MMHKVGKAVVITILIIALGVSIYFSFASQNERIYETNELRDYMNITGNYDNARPKEYISSFFPAVIEENFQNTTYHYKAKKGDTYAYEACLEFTIEDLESYQSYLSNLVDRGNCEKFPYDESYYAKTISNVLLTDTVYDDAGEEVRYIEMAEIGLILFSDEEQRLIFMAVGVLDGGGVTTAELDFFFEKFEIAPEEYEEQAYPATWFASTAG